VYSAHVLVPRAGLEPAL